MDLGVLLIAFAGLGALVAVVVATWLFDETRREWREELEARLARMERERES